LTRTTDPAPANNPPTSLFHFVSGNADFRRVWLIGIFSGIVRWLEMLAFGIYVFDLTGSAFLVTSFTLMRFIPFALFGPVTGSLVDRFGQQNILRWSLAFMFLTSGVLAWLATSGRLELWHLAMASIFAGFYWTTDFPARRNLIGELAGPDLLARALSFDAASNTMTRALGPLTGGVLMATLGISGILGLTMIMYFLSFVLALRLMSRNKTLQRATAGLAREILAGFRFARTRPDILAAFSITIIFNLFGFPFTALIPVIGKQTLHLTPDGVGLIAAAEGIGAMTGAVLAGRSKTIGQVWASYGGGVSFCMIGILVMGTGQDVAWVATGIIAAGFGGGFFAATQVMIIYRLAPPDQRSRMLGILTFCIGSAPVGFAVLGYMSDWLGTGPALVIMGVEGIIAMSLFWLIFRHAIRASTR
jgi:MFS family permease